MAKKRRKEERKKEKSKSWRIGERQDNYKIVANVNATKRVMLERESKIRATVTSQRKSLSKPVVVQMYKNERRKKREMRQKEKKRKKEERKGVAPFFFLLVVGHPSAKSCIGHTTSDTRDYLGMYDFTAKGWHGTH